MAVAAGSDHCLALKDNGSIVAWGNNERGQCDVPYPNTDFVAIEANFNRSMGLTSEGRIVAWGEGGGGNPPGPNSGYVAVAAGDWHSLALRADGSIMAWGDNSYGQCDVPSPNAGFVAISAGRLSSTGLRRLTTPVTIQDLNAEAGPGYVDVRWAAVLDGPAELAVVRGTEEAGPFVPVSPQMNAGKGRSVFTYRDRSVQSSSAYYYAIACREDGGWNRSAVILAVTPAGAFGFVGVKPNPSSEGPIRLGFELLRPDRAQLVIYDAAGRNVRVLSDAVFGVGVWWVSWNGAGENGVRLPSGIYFVRLASGGRVATRRLVLIR